MLKEAGITAFADIQDKAHFPAGGKIDGAPQERFHDTASVCVAVKLIKSLTPEPICCSTQRHYIMYM